MMTPYSANSMLDVLAGKSVGPASLNADVVAHLAAKPVALPVALPDAWPLRLLPGFVRGPLKAWIAARAYERSLVSLWEISPHLLSDMGVVLTANGNLPDHLVAAPARVIDHVAAIAPEQIVAAEMSYLPARAKAPYAGSAAAERPAAGFPFASAT